ncbi:hypothetical protein JD844_003041 [Phrynosoma platyrhinos]|uniref:Dynein axonemal heavy chain 11 n=1 Tax=Phrynosoma platyrhinos TaxID=52577 RepID=A0ABQ7TD25_PHRPL|nr:hypothetical protein JD844_003041 [Phrynosoma platyrhinos]
MEGDEEEASVPEESFSDDPRVQFVGRRLEPLLRLKEGKWSAFLGEEEEEGNQSLLRDFLESSHTPVLAFYLPPGRGLEAEAKLPSGMKCKVVCITKTTDYIQTEDFKETLKFSELSETPMEHLMVALEEVILPILSSKTNNGSWPQFISKDMERHVEIMKNKTYVMGGIMAGRTLLPIPTVATEIELHEMCTENKQDSHTRSVLHAIESMVIKWSHQIRDILAEKSTQSLLQGLHPVPQTELNFWKERKDNLLCIFGQLKSPVIQQMIRVLKAKMSSYYPTFQDIYKEVENALTEAQDIDLYLRPLQRHIELLIVSRVLADLLLVLNITVKNCSKPVLMTITYLSPEDIMKRETEEALEQVQKALSTLRNFKEAFFKQRSKMATYFTSTQEVKPWDFQPQMVFSRFDKFLHRLENIEDIFITMLEFERLEKLEFGGIKGKTLNDKIYKLSEEFIESCNIFKERTYDPTDYSNVAFTEDYADFKHKILEFERRLGSIFCVAFLDCSGLESAFKLLVILGYFLEKPVIADIFSPNYNILLQMFDEELNNCKFLYDEHIKQVDKRNETINKNMPFTSGNIMWSQEIKARIKSFWSNFSFVSHTVLECSEAALIHQKYIEMLTLLDQYEDQTYHKWKSAVDDICQFNLAQPLIKRNNEDGLLSVNFDSKLVAVLRDVKYLLLLNQPDIPRSALELYNKRETFTKYIQNLELIAQWYNKVKQTVLEVEYPLIEKEMQIADEQLKEAEEVFTWQEENCWKYIEFLKTKIHDLEQRLQMSKNNIKAIQQIMKSWVEHPIFSRKDNRKEALLNLEDKEETLTKKFMSFQEDGRKIHMLVKENFMLFEADPDSDSWKIYLEFIDDIIIDGFFNAIMYNLNFFLENTEEILKPAPLFQVQMILSTLEIEFKPSLDKEAGDGFYDLIDELLSNIFRISAEVTRVAAHLEMQHYQNDMDSISELSETRQKIMDRVADVITKASDFKNSLDSYAYLWVDDRSEFMKQFLFYGPVLASEETETRMDIRPNQHPIDIYENLYTQMSKLEDFRIFESWFKVDMKLFKISLLNIIKKWSWMFKEYLLRFVIDSLANLEEFIKTTDVGLHKELKEGEYGLVDVLVHLLAVKDRQVATDELFEPLKDTIMLLENYGQKVPEHVYVQLEELPERWNATKKLALSVKLEVTPLLTSEVTSLRKKCSAFDGKQIEFRERFRVDAPFHFDAKNPYALLDKANQELEALEEEMLQIQASANLFEVVIPDYKQMKQCRKEIKLLKGLWDINIYVTVQFSLTDNTTLADMLAWKLHTMEDDVQNIVDKAVKELGTEKILIEISQIWATMEFSYQAHYRTGIPLLKMDEQLFEMLDNNQVQLQTILQSKYVEYFIEEVLRWQKKLNVADSVIFIWMEVQRTWSHLESIFIGSNDIRDQLPEDSKSFDGIDADFKELMNDSANTKNVLEATTKPKLYEKLEDLQYRLSLCEKALAEYLETKRLAFPRFYFVSSADLLDILSKGAQPRQVTCHLIKLFDNIADLKFQDDKESSRNFVLGMYSKEKEYVPFNAEFKCSGQTWLKHLEEIMRETVRHQITEAITVYEEKPREQWIFDYPAQVALTGSQIWWTTDVAIAFNRLEEGFETALKDYHKKQIVQLNALISLLLGELTSSDRQKIMTICTIDVHARDVVAKLITQKITSSQAFAWLSQLRHTWSLAQKHCFANICDAQFQYYYEYLGNTPRLVITPLTDRPCAMVVPDIELICEIMLVAEGFVDARLLARKFITLYTLCGELLSKQVLMRALRDFNLPKIVTDDVPIFMGLISDLFPALDVPRKRDLHFEQMVKQSTLELHLQPEESFILKIMKTLNKTYVNMKQKPVWNYLNPKVVTTDELFGLLSSLLREQANITHSWPKWIVLDGDIDPMWIESLNTVMDDNKVLTLASNERIPLTPSMRLLFEIHHLKTATPATVSRAGILYVNPQDLGWNPYVASWIEQRSHQSEKANLTILFDKYTLCSLLDCLLTPENLPSDGPRELYEIYFAFACVWAFGGALFQDQVNAKFEIAEYFADMPPSQMAVVALFVHTSETTCLRYFLDLLLKKGKPVMLVGNAGVGKTVFIEECLAGLSEDFLVSRVPFNYYTTSAVLQRILEKTLEKKAGRNYGPLGNKKLVYFVDDMNLPEVDVYGTVQPHTLIRQHIDYGHWYDRQTLTLKEVHNCQYVACMNPTVGSFTINPRLQGILFAKQQCLKHPNDLVRLWLHESSRVYGDKLVEEKDCTLFHKKLIDTAHKYFEDVEDHILLQQPLIYCHFANGVADPNYMPVKDWEVLRKILVETLENYNELNASMNLVLFEDAIQHVCRISRILESSRGYALLIGVGGSGKQSLSRLAAYIGSLEVFQITLKKDYTIQDLKVDLANLYIKTGAKNIPTVFILTDAQVPDERFLVLINDLLASGEVADLFTDEDMDGIITGIRSEIRGLGLLDTRENCWKFFLDRVQLQLKIILCFSPVGSTLRVRARKFPAIVNCTAIDWFHEWPQEALHSVSRRFIEEMPGIKPQFHDTICYFMAYAHTSVNTMSVKFRQNEKRYNYTTPKSFLEQIMLYKNLLEKKIQKMSQHKEHLVEDLKYKLASQEAELKLRNQDAEALITKIGLQTEKVSKEKAIADAEEQKVVAIQTEVSQKQKECEDDLVKAEPALVAATAALNTLNKVNLSELKAFPNPPVAVTNVAAAVMVLLASKGKVPKDRTWKAAKLFMGKVDEFLQALINYDKEHIPENCLKVVKEHYLKDPEFNPNLVRTKSFAAAGLCAWVINIVKFYEVYCDVEPKRQALAQANAELAAATEKLVAIRKKLAELDLNLCKLTASFEKATAEKSENVRWTQSIKSFEEQEVTVCGDVLLTAAFVSYVGSFTKLYRHELVESMWLPFLKSQKNPIPISKDLDLVAMLTDDAMIASWNNEGLPSDRMSIENAAILTNCECWPLLIDPQLQGIKWIKNKYGTDLKIVQLGQKGFLKTIERALACGDVVLIKNLEEVVDPVLDPLLGRNTVKRGMFIKIEDKECEFNKNFRLILHTKLANPHYKPELQAQSTLINFTVTKDGLEDQLLAEAVSIERPDLEAFKSLLTKQQNDFKIQLKVLEDDLLFRLSAAEGSFLGDTELVEKLETTKSTAAEIELKAFATTI